MSNHKERPVFVAAAMYTTHEGQPDDVYHVIAMAVCDAKLSESKEPVKQVKLLDDGPCGCETISLWR